MRNNKRRGRPQRYPALALAAAVVALIAGLFWQAQDGERTAARVERVVDGDTVICEMNGERTRVRMIGVNTPESVKPDSPVEYYGEEASAFTKAALEGRTVELEYDQERLDQYGRTLAYLYVDGELFNERLLREGYARLMFYEPNTKYKERFQQSERCARERGLGIWQSASRAG